MKTLAITIIIVIAILAALILALPAFLGPDDLSSCNKAPSGHGQCQKADAIIAISGGDTKARAAEAIALYQHGWAPLLIFSGAAKDKSGPSNALVMKRQAVAAGVPASDVLVEQFSRTTAENAKNTDKFIKNRSLNRIILVTSAYHQRRASIEFKAITGSRVEIVNHPVANDDQWSKHWYLTGIGWRLALSELAKIIVISFTIDGN